MAGDRIRAGRYRVQARFQRSVLLFGEAGTVLFVVDRSIGAGPLNWVVSHPAAYVCTEWLEIPQQTEAPRFVSAMPRPEKEARGKLLRILIQTLPLHAPADSLISLWTGTDGGENFQRRRDRVIELGLREATSGRLASGIRRLRGCGMGLTPSGDDFLCGWLLACRLCGSGDMAREIAEQAKGGNRVSNALIELASQGRVNRVLQDLLKAPNSARVGAVCGCGHTSGADLLCGLRYGLENS